MNSLLQALYATQFRYKEKKRKKEEQEISGEKKTLEISGEKKRKEREGSLNLGSWDGQRQKKKK